MAGDTGNRESAAWGYVPATPRPDVQGKESWSESIMVVYLSDDLRTGFSFRICRFPDLDDTWLWCHVIADGTMYAFTGQYLPCETRRNDPADARAVYDAPGAQAHITRIGPSADLTRTEFSARLKCRAGTEAAEGGGDVDVVLSGEFVPDLLHPTLLPGRFERLGRVRASLSIDGRSHAIDDIAKQHEQTQTAPRFLVPFTYCEMWNAEASILGLLANGRSHGAFEEGTRRRALESFAIAAPAQDRRFRARLADGTVIDGTARAAITFRIPVFDRVWRGSMVSCEIGGKRLVGTLNDWRHDAQRYAEDL